MSNIKGFAEFLYRVAHTAENEEEFSFQLLQLILVASMDTLKDAGLVTGGPIALSGDALLFRERLMKMALAEDSAELIEQI